MSGWNRQGGVCGRTCAHCPVHPSIPTCGFCLSPSLSFSPVDACYDGVCGDRPRETDLSLEPHFACKNRALPPSLSRAVANTELARSGQGELSLS